MDDFGTGYSSLSYLQHFPVDTLKIDKSFVEWMHIDEQSELIVRTVIDLAHNLKMSVVAEGVESEEHASRLKALGCDYGQGYYYARPLDAPAARTYLHKMIAEDLA
jgi:EAL domain-containing protein (putative c-di-GMP-specific phosphodiesterase class I)